MKTSAFLRVLVVAAVLLGCWPQFAFAQRGGGGGGFHGGGGGGFHGGGGFAGGGAHGFGGGAFHGGGALNGSAGGRFGYPGGHSLGGYHSGGYHSGHGGYAWHNGHGGWHGGYWGYGHRHYGWGWGYPWPYWGWGWGWGYPYGYYYYPWTYSPYSYDTPYCPPGYWCPPDQNDDPPPQNPARKSGMTPAEPWRPAVRNPRTSYAGTNQVAHSGRVADPALQENASRRTEVLNAMRELREMPPFAREREIETGRYSQFSPAERELLRSFDADLRRESQSDSAGFALAVAHSW